MWAFFFFFLFFKSHFTKYFFKIFIRHTWIVSVCVCVCILNAHGLVLSQITCILPVLWCIRLRFLTLQLIISLPCSVHVVFISYVIVYWALKSTLQEQGQVRGTGWRADKGSSGGWKSQRHKRKKCIFLLGTFCHRLTKRMGEREEGGVTCTKGLLTMNQIVDTVPWIPLALACAELV